MKKYLGAFNPLGKPVSGKSTDVLVGGLVGLLVAGLTKKYVVDNVLKDPTSKAKQFLDGYWSIVGGVVSAAALGAFSGKVPGLKKFNANALAAGALVAGVAPAAYGLVAGKVPFLSDTVAVNLNGYHGLIVNDRLNGFGLMTQEQPAALRAYGDDAEDFDGLAALSMSEDEDDGFNDLVQVAV